MSMWMMQRLFRSLGSLWSDDPGEKPALTVLQGTGTYSMLSFDGDTVYLHSTPFDVNNPNMQTIAVAGLKLTDLVTKINALGYQATVVSSFGSLAPYALTEVTNVPMGTALNVFTTNNWTFLYPLYKLLKNADFDINKAIQAMYIPTARGKWLDYWATFFGMRRNASEADSTFLGRVLLTLRNPLTNNYAMTEMLTQTFQAYFDVEDASPLNFTVWSDPSQIPNGAQIKTLVNQIKGAGIAYVVNYKALMSEDYRSSFLNLNGTDFKNADTLGGVELTLSEDKYGVVATDAGWVTNQSLTNTADTGGGMLMKELSYQMYYNSPSDPSYTIVYL